MTTPAAEGFFKSPFPVQHPAKASDEIQFPPLLQLQANDFDEATAQGSVVTRPPLTCVITRTKSLSRPQPAVLHLHSSD